MTQKEFMASTVIAFFHNLFHSELLMRFWVKRNSNDPHLFLQSTFTSSIQLLDVICVKITFLRETAQTQLSMAGYGIDDLGSIPGRGNDLSSPSSRDWLWGYTKSRTQHCFWSLRRDMQQWLHLITRLIPWWQIYSAKAILFTSYLVLLRFS